MKRAVDARMPRYLAAHALLGGILGALSGVIIVTTDVVGLATLAQADAGAFILVPALAGLFALCGAVSALAWLPPHDDGTVERNPCIDLRRAVRLRVPTHH